MDDMRTAGRASRGWYATGSFVLLGSVASASMGIAAPADASEHTHSPQASRNEKQSDLDRRGIVGAVSSIDARAPITATVVAGGAPATYQVIAGDTISAIAATFGLSTASVLALNGLGWSSLIFPGQTLILNTDAAVAALPAAAPSPTSARTDQYEILAGDTINAIAARLGVAALSILEANGLGWSSIIYPGQTLAIPGFANEPTGDIELVAHTENLTSDGDVAAPPDAAAVDGASYVIQSGDTVGAIAEAFGVSTDAVLMANGLTGSSIIYFGATLVIPPVTIRPPVTTRPPVTIVPPVTIGPAGTTALDEEMAHNARIVVDVGRELNVPDYGIVIALATAMQESSMRNLNWGDRDSVGLFQQRPSTGWGSVADLTTPAHAARLFYGGQHNPNTGHTRGLLDVPNWPSMTLTQAAQSVQISAYPDAYAQWEISAWAWLAELG